MSDEHVVRITGLGTYLPRLVHTNETLPPLDEPATPHDLARIGVHARGWASPDDEGVAEMAAHAAKRALAQADLVAKDLDAILLANWTQRRYLPDFAPRLKTLLGADRAFAFDLGCACTGFLYGLGAASDFLRNPRYKRALVVASETTSQRARPGSRGTLILGDAAGAMIIERGGDPRAPGHLVDIELDADGAHAGIMEISAEGWVKTYVEQRELCTLAAKSIHELAGRLLARHHVALSDVAWVVPHSGTAGVQAALVRELGIPPEKMLTNYGDVGNVSSASIPVALEHFLRIGKIRPGDLILSGAVGGGWYKAAALYTAPELRA